MENLVSNVVRLEFDEVESYVFPLDEAFGLEVMYEGIKFCFIINLSSTNKNLICCGSGAQQRNRKSSKGIPISPPFFDRWSWFKYFEESFIVYSDPIFFYDDKIRLGWYVGDKNQWYLETISNIIKMIAINQGIHFSDILCYGSSGGGFASICLGTLIKESHVLVNNAQFNIMNYYKSFTEDLLRVLQNEFQGASQSEILNGIDFRLNTIDLFKKENYVPPIDYYINMKSDADLTRHCLPFIEDIKELGCFNDELTVHFYNEEKDKPHLPLPINDSVELIKTFAKQYLYNNVD